jgi:uncharacterized protein
MRPHFLAPLFLLLASLTAACAGNVDDGSIGSTGAAVSGRPYFQLWQSTANAQWYFRLRAANHETILASEGYVSRTNALNGILSVRDHGGSESRYEVRQASNGQYYFVLHAVNGQIIGMSELYVSRYNAERGVQTVINNLVTYETWAANRTGARFEVTRGTDGKWYFDLLGANDQVVLVSQAYVLEESAWNGMFSVQDNGSDAARYAFTQGVNGEWFFDVIATNGQSVGKSTAYATLADAQAGRDALVALLPAVELL